MKNHRPKAKSVPKIPPPPGPGASYDEIIAYHSRYTLDELEQAGYTEDVPEEHRREVAASAEYWFLCREGLHLKLTRKEYEQLSYLAARKKVPAEKLVTKWVRERLQEEAKVLAKS